MTKAEQTAAPLAAARQLDATCSPSPPLCTTRTVDGTGASVDQ